VGRAREKQPFASFTIWRSDLDAEKLRSPVERLKYPRDLDPTIEGDTVWLTEDVVKDIEQRIQGISIPIYLGEPQVIGCDGTRFEFHYDALFYGATIHWWEDHPNEWRSFTNTITRIIEELQERRKKQADNSASAANPLPGL
jgi:hypothetical protein